MHADCASHNITHCAEFSIQAVLQPDGLITEKLFPTALNHCSQSSKTFEVGKTLLGVVIDWSDAEAAGLNLAVGEHKAGELLKGCKVYWQRSCLQMVKQLILNSRLFFT